MSSIDTLDNDVVDNGGDDFSTISIEIFKKINFKCAIFIILAGILIFSDIFVEGILVKIKGAVESGCPNTKGTLIQLVLLSLSYIIVSLLIEGGVL